MTTPVSQVSRSERIFRGAELVFATGLAWLIFLLGAISPLTPSEGSPSILSILVFVGAPLVLLGIVIARARTTAVKILTGSQAVALLGFAIWIVSLSWGR